jgi:nucleotide-binding universal stress UspA family protein
MNEIRRLLVHLSDSERSREVLAYAVKIAVQHEATICAARVTEPVYRGVYLSPEMAMAALQLQDEAQRQGAERAEGWISDVERSSGLKIEFHSQSGNAVEIMSAFAHDADVVLMEQPFREDVAGPSRRFASHVMMSVGCPVLFVPAVGQFDSVASNVLVAWAPTRESSRALRDALPFLQSAKSVEVLWFGTTPAGTTEPLDAVERFLGAHGVKATCSARSLRERSFTERMLTPTIVDATVAELILSRAADINADLLVMGGYGHSRAYEMVLGGVTQTILKAMPVPVLMSH